MVFTMRSQLEPWTNKVVHVTGRVAGFGVGELPGVRSKHVTILLKDLEVVRDGKCIKLSHIWIMPSKRDVTTNLHVGDTVRFDANVYCYQKLTRDLKYVRSYGLKQIKHLYILKPGDGKSYLDALAAIV